MAEMTEEDEKEDPGQRADDGGAEQGGPMAGDEVEDLGG